MEENETLYLSHARCLCLAHGAEYAPLMLTGDRLGSLQDNRGDGGWQNPDRNVGSVDVMLASLSAIKATLSK